MGPARHRPLELAPAEVRSGREPCSEPRSACILVLARLRADEECGRRAQEIGRAYRAVDNAPLAPVLAIGAKAAMEEGKGRRFNRSCKDLNFQYPRPATGGAIVSHRTICAPMAQLVAQRVQSPAQTSSTTCWPSASIAGTGWKPPQRERCAKPPRHPGMLD